MPTPLTEPSPILERDTPANRERGTRTSSVTMSALTFNLDDGFTEAVVRGYRSGILTSADYSNLGQCDGLEDMRMHLAVTDYGNFLQNEPSPLQTMTISEKCTEKLVDEFNYIRCNASGELAKFLDYITYGCLAHPCPNSSRAPPCLQSYTTKSRRTTSGGVSWVALVCSFTLSLHSHVLGGMVPVVVLTCATSPCAVYTLVTAATAAGSLPCSPRRSYCVSQMRFVLAEQVHDR
jgi:hypothetical protein